MSPSFCQVTIKNRMTKQDISCLASQNLFSRPDIIPYLLMFQGNSVWLWWRDVLSWVLFQVENVFSVNQSGPTLQIRVDHCTVAVVFIIEFWVLWLGFLGSWFLAWHTKCFQVVLLRAASGYLGSLKWQMFPSLCWYFKANKLALYHFALRWMFAVWLHNT